MQLQLKDLSLHYKDKSPLFQNVNLTVNSGDFILIQGPSGSGKSSLLRLLNRLQDPTSGDILIGGRPVTGYEVTELRRKIGYVQQTPIVVETTVQDNLVLPFHFKVADGQAPPHPGKTCESGWTTFSSRMWTWTMRRRPSLWARNSASP